MQSILNAVSASLKSAGDELLAKHNYTVRQKGGRNDFITDMDIRMQELLRTALTSILPEAAFVSEEDLSASPAEGQLFWLIDPIDGTTNFIRNLHLSCLSVALCRDHEVILAAVYHPWSGELFTAQRGHGAFLNGERIQVSGNELADGIFCYGQGYGARQETLKIMRPLWEKCYAECVNTRAFGVAELTLCYLAAGRCEVYAEQAIQPWDYAAGGLIVKEAGGTITNFHGDACSLAHGDSMLAGNKTCHAALLPLTQTLL